MIGNFYLPINYFFVFYPAHHQLRNNLHHKNISGGKAKKPNSLLNRELGFLLCRNLELTNIFLSIILYSTKLTIVNQKRLGVSLMKKLLLGIALVFILGVSVFYLNIYHSYTAYQKLSETDKIEYSLRSPISYMIMKDSLFWVNDI